MKYLYIRTIGSVEESTLDFLRKQLHDYISCHLKILRDKRYPLFAFAPERNQYYSKKIIEHLADNIPSNCEKMLVITDVDLCTPILSFVFGEAQLDGTIAIVSFRRLQQEFYKLPRDLYLMHMRLLKECLHELGHCYGLYHCRNTQCIMYLSNTVFHIDSKDKEFCINCNKFFREKLRKEQHGQK